MSNNFLIAFGLTLIAGLSTGIGSAFSFLTKKTNTKFLSTILGFSAGIMIYVSMIEIFDQAKDMLIKVFGQFKGVGITSISFFSGIFLIAIIDKLVPSYDNPHELHKVEEIDVCSINNKKLLKTGTLMALAIAIHNFPEGIATFTSSINNLSIGVPIAIAIAIHNIPEGIAVSVPLYCATGDRKKAFIWSFMSGISEPIGAIIGYIVLRPFLNDSFMGIILAAVAGIMVFISLDELLPTAEEYGEHHLAIYGLIAGMIVMSISLLLFM